ncbi:ATP-binding cassette domain-containing protein [Paraferrimonas sp. SM1919]|uniref:ATP-binding cassette domain-containing protein n=1 Tax=Paraferrimonas sp. SM1919 TaxID=2662263 RepID=UPI0013D2EFD4|nr:ATP-binding cassette domain-containing protein [Paraferrimonas sp. SM1919]
MEFLNRFKSQIISILFFSVAINLFYFVIPLYTLQAFDRVLMSESIDTLIWLTIIAAGLLLIQAILEWVRNQLLHTQSIAIENQYKAIAFKNSFHHNAINQTQLKDVDIVKQSIAASGAITFFDAPYAPIFLLGLFLLHPTLGFFTLFGLLLLSAIMLVSNYFQQRSAAKVQKTNDALAIIDNDWLAKTELVSALGMGANLTKQSERNSKLNQQATALNGASKRSSQAVTKACRLFLQLGLLFIAVQLILQNQISAGVLIAASMLMARVLAPVEQAINNFGSWKVAFRAYKRLQAMVQCDQEAETIKEQAKGNYKLDEVQINKPGQDAPLVIKKSSAQIPAGSCTAIIGPTGSGKTLLLKTLLGLHPAHDGHVYLEGLNINRWGTEQLSGHIGYVPQHCRLFSGTIAQNIARFEQELSPVAIINAAKLAGAHEMILALEHGYQTVVGDVGVALSQGQVKKIGLAMALYNRPSIMILDEPDCCLDHQGLTQLGSLIKENNQSGITTIMVTSRPSLLQLSQQCLVIKGRQIHTQQSNQIFDLNAHRNNKVVK